MFGSTEKNTPCTHQYKSAVDRQIHTHTHTDMRLSSRLMALWRFINFVLLLLLLLLFF